MCEYRDYHKYGSPKPRENQVPPYGGCWSNGEYKYFKACTEKCPYYYRDDEKKIISCNTCYWPDYWVCGKHVGNPEEQNKWEFIGVFDTKDKAVKACRFESYFIAPAKLNESFPNETVEWVGAYYPVAQSLFTPIKEKSSLQNQSNGTAPPDISFKGEV